MEHGLPSRQTVNVVGGRLRARDVRVGSSLWTVDGERTVRTTVTQVLAAKVREVVDVTTERTTFTVAPHQLLGIVGGWVPAREAADRVLAWTHARKLCRERLEIKPGYDFGYMVGAVCSRPGTRSSC
ncbi:hypothetical protein ABT127_37580 [Streptomyces sp. NPDC001904]|uniref:hypothetical protein n=1 Tax=Streptomyces sp. NPDC001904 TaxID=3154531 RepID=UPI003329845C